MQFSQTNNNCGDVINQGVVIKETQQTVGTWIDNTFPGTNPESPRKCLRALEEMLELCLEAGASPRDIQEAVDNHTFNLLPHSRKAEWDKVAAEAADVLIALYGVAHMRDFDLHSKVDRKMQINRARKWRANGDGTGYHIKETN